MTLLTLLAAIALLCLWVVFTFVIPAGLGIVHVLLGLGAAPLVLQPPSLAAGRGGGRCAHGSSTRPCFESRVRMLIARCGPFGARETDHGSVPGHARRTL